jgi:para-nitrobenzyl esterase
VTCLLSSPRAHGLFAGAIAQSGFAADTLAPDQASRVPSHVAETFGIANTREAICEIPPADLALFSAGLVEELELHPDPEKWGDLAAIGSPFSPTVDGDILPTNPIESFRRGRGDEVALLIGSNRDEARLTLIADGSLGEVTDSDLRVTAQDLGLSRDGVKIYREVHPSASPGDLLAAILTDWIYTLSPIRVSEAREKSVAKTWLYRFDHPDEGSNNGLGACHGAELPFVFDCIDLPEVRPRIGASPNQDVADLVHRTWVDFVTDANPGWVSSSLSERPTALLSDKLSIVSDPARAQRLAWDGVR